MVLARAVRALLKSCLFFGAVQTLDSSRPAYAREDAVPGSRIITARSGALADAYLPLGEDGESALFYNPADIGKIRNSQFEALNFQFYGGGGYFSEFSLTNPTFQKVTSLSGYLPTMQANPGNWSSVGAAVFPNFYTRGFAFGLLFQNHLGGQVNSDGTVHYRSTYQLIPTAGTGLRLAGGIVRIGYSLQWVNQSVGNFDKVSASSPTLGYNQGLAEGSGLSHNLGFALTLPWQYLPSFNLVARNVLGVHYSPTTLYHFAANGSGTPADEPMTLDASLSIQPKLGFGGFANVVFEYRDMTNTSGISWLGRLAASLEVSYRDQIFLRGGWGSGYPSAGLGLRRKGGEFSISWYSEELGTSYQSQRDSRFIVQYQIRPFQP